jgi:hypothetical protein
MHVHLTEIFQPKREWLPRVFNDVRLFFSYEIQTLWMTPFSGDASGGGVCVSEYLHQCTSVVVLLSHAHFSSGRAIPQILEASLSRKPDSSGHVKFF